jgi:hypothetical protein
MSYENLSVKELKELLSDQGIPICGLLEKQDLISALRSNAPSQPSSSSARMSTSELKEVIRHMAGRVVGLFERSDVLNRLRELLNGISCAICLDLLIEDGRQILTSVPCCALSKGVYHASCLQMYVLKAAEDGRWPVSCVGCARALDEHTIKTKVFLNNVPTYEKYMNIVNKLKQLRQQKDNSLTDELLKSLDPKMYRQCPKCKTIIEKGPAKEILGIFQIPGCDKMTCRCGHQFCYRCGADKGQCNCAGAEHEFFSHEDVMKDYPGARI